MQFPLLHRSDSRHLNRSSCSRFRAENQCLTQSISEPISPRRAGPCERTLLPELSSETHHASYTAAVVPASVNEDHLPRRREVLYGTLKGTLGAFFVGRFSEGAAHSAFDVASFDWCQLRPRDAK